jgi:hypothetical protein
MYVELSILNDEVHSTPVLQLYAVDSLYILSFISKVQRFFFVQKCVMFTLSTMKLI